MQEKARGNRASSKRFVITMTVSTDKKIDFPRMMRVRQVFEETPPVDIPAAVAAEMKVVRGDLKPGLRVAVAVGSRGITNLKELHLERNEVGDAGAIAIANSSNFSYLTFINFWKNRVGAEGAKAIASSTHLVNLKNLS